MTDQADQADGDFLAAIFDAARRWEVATGRRVPNKVLRESLWFVWQAPRLPRPLVRSKYRRIRLECFHLRSPTKAFTRDWWRRK